MTFYYKLIIMPFIGCFIGWLTNYIAIKLLFRPHKPLNVLGVKLQGLIPKRRKEIAASIARAIESELLSSKDIASTLGSIDWKDEVEQAVEEAVEHRLAKSKLKNIPLVGLLSDNITYRVKYLITKDLLSQIEKKKDGLFKKVTDSMDVQGMLASKIDDLDFMRFESLLTEFIARELRHIEWLGGVMGFTIGLIQALIFLMIL